MADLTSTATITQAPEPFFDEDDFSEDLLDDERDDDGVEPDELLFAPEPFEEEEDDFIDDDPVVFAAPPAAADGASDTRLAKLEAAARELAAAEVTRENRRVKRKVTAATAGAGAAGFIPILLELVDAYNLDPAVGMAVAAIASLLGAFVSGWMTPERTPPLPEDSAHTLLKL